MNRRVAIAPGSASLVVAVALFLAGQAIPGAVALVVSVAFDVVFVLASRGAAAPCRGR